MYTGYMDLPTFLLYIVMALTAFACIRLAKITGGRIALTKTVTVEKRLLFYAVLVAVFTFLAMFRSVDVRLGGADALNYKNIFLECFDPDSEYADLVTEPLFRLYCQAIRLFTDDYRVFFGVSYGFIALSYCLFAEKYCPQNGWHFPFILLCFLYLRAFCTLRSSLAVAVFLVALVCIDRHRITGLLLMVSTVLIHRASVAYAVLPLFALLCGRIVKKLEGWRLGLFLLGLGFAGVWAARGLQYALVALDILGRTDSWYLSNSMGTNLFARFPMYFTQFLLMIAMILVGDRVGKSPRMGRIKLLCCYDIVIMPATVVLGLWRSNEYLYLARLVMWSALAPKGEALFLETAGRIPVLKENRYWMTLCGGKNGKCLYWAAMSLAFLVWLCFRIYSEWDDLKIMPYVLDLF